MATPEELDQRVRILERKLELEAEKNEALAKSQGQAVASRDGFEVKSADNAFRLKLRGYLQVDGRFFLDDEELPATDSWVIRRARPVLEGTLFKFVDFKIMPDFGGGTTVLYDAYIEARFSKAARLRAGKFKPPVGLERLQSATDLLFVERAFPTGLVPSRDIGLQLGGELARRQARVPGRALQRRRRRRPRRPGHRRRQGVRRTPALEAVPAARTAAFRRSTWRSVWRRPAATRRVR